MNLEPPGCLNQALSGGAKQRRMESSMIERLKKREAKIGLFGVGIKRYFEQFTTLGEDCARGHDKLIEYIKANDVEVVDFGISDTSIKAYEINDRIKAEKLDILFCDMLTYSTSCNFAPIIRDASIPVILVALQPMKGMDYSKASMYMQILNDNICSVPEFTNTAVRMGKKVSDVILGYLYDDATAITEISRWCEIAKVLHDLKGARLGYMGHVYEAMYDMHADPTAVSAAFGLHCPLLELDDLNDCVNTVTENEIKEKEKTILKEFDTPDPKTDPLTKKLTKEDLYIAAKTAVGLDKFRDKYSLTGLAYYYEGSENSIHRLIESSVIVGNSLLTGAGFPMCHEQDIKTCIAMLIMDRLNIGGSFAEFHPFDFNGDFILIGHDGPHHINIAEGKPILRSLSLYHGKVGCGASVEFKIKEGPITMLGITTNAEGKFKFVIGEGISRKGPIPPTGNTNTRVTFEPDTRKFVKAWVMEAPTHHYALGVGHHAETIKMIGEALGIESVIVKI